MKLFYYITVLLGFSLGLSAQDMGGTPVDNIIPIKKVGNSNTKNTIETTNTNSSSKMLSTASITPTGNSSEVCITDGQLSVSLTGGASYTIPIMVPSGINGVVPQVNLVYNSQGSNGLAGYGWNIAGVSSIKKIPSTAFHDGNIDAVYFDTSDRFALDGQRLIGAVGSTYSGNLAT